MRRRSPERQQAPRRQHSEAVTKGSTDRFADGIPEAIAVVKLGVEKLHSLCLEHVFVAALGVVRHVVRRHPHAPARAAKCRDEVCDVVI